MSEHAAAQARDELPSPLHEPRDVTVRFVVWFCSSIAVGVVAMAVLAAVLYPQAGGVGLRAGEFPQPAQPALQSSPRTDMAALRSGQVALLNSAGWVDRAHGVVHVPIERAMRDLAAHGIEGWPQ